MTRSKTMILFASFFLLFSRLVAPCIAAQPPGTGDAGPVRVVILPFAINTPANLSYLQSGIRDMLTSRLSLQGKVQVVDKLETDKAARGEKEISQGEAVRIGAGLKADYVLYGSITSTGQSVSIDATMAPVSGKGDPVSFFAQTKSLDDVTPQVNLFAQQINQKVFGKPEEKKQTATAEAEEQATRNPDLLLSGLAATRGKISYVNPLFADATREGPLTQPDLWKSQDFQGGILGMDIGDVDGDGKAEIVAMQMNKLIVYKKENEGLHPVATFEGSPVDRFVWVSVADISGEGKSYIYLTSLRKGNATGKDEVISSYVLALSGGKIQVAAEGVPYFLNAIHLGQRGKVLVGQKQGAKSHSLFDGEIFEMQFRGGSLVPGPAVSTPKGANIFNFVKVDIKNDKDNEIVMVDDTHKLRVLKAAGDLVWKGGGLWAVTTNSFKDNVGGFLWKKAESYDIPSPIIVAGLRKNGVPEIVLTRNTTSDSKWEANSKKYCDRGEVVSLSWDSPNLTENWTTTQLNGQITSLRIGDIEGNATRQLVISMVYAKDLHKLYDSRSVIFIYDLNVKEGPAPKNGH